MTPRHDLDTRTALVRSVSDQALTFDESRLMPVPYSGPPTFCSAINSHLSGRGDLNSCSPDPQSGALTKLGHVPPRHHVATGSACPPDVGRLS
jgi:hypothetical protein